MLILGWMRCQLFKTFQEAFQKPLTIIKWDYNVELCFYHFPTNSESTWEADSPEIFVFSQPNFTIWWNHGIVHSQPHSRHCASAKCKYYGLIPDYWDQANSVTTKFLVVSQCWEMKIQLQDSPRTKSSRSFSVLKPSPNKSYKSVLSLPTPIRFK